MHHPLKHLLAAALPLMVVVFGLTAPHSTLVAAVFLGILVLAITLDIFASPVRTLPDPTAQGWIFEALLYLLFGVHFINLGLLISLPFRGAGAFDLAVCVILTGTSSGYTAIVLAHELIHRRRKLAVTLGRLLLISVIYEHFYTEHIRGHHVRVGTVDDAATARFGEHFYPFLVRTIPSQFRSAWRIETRRTKGTSWRHRVLQGVIAQLLVATVLVTAFGVASFMLWLTNAAIAILLLEAVNYFEHWGISRTGSRVRTIDSWDTDSWFTYYALIGLSRHADHHAYAGKPYHALAPCDESLKLPWGYFGTTIAVIFVGWIVRPRLVAELQRKQLGPFEQDSAVGTPVAVL